MNKNNNTEAQPAKRRAAKLLTIGALTAMLASGVAAGAVANAAEPGHAAQADVATAPAQAGHKQQQEAGQAHVTIRHTTGDPGEDIDSAATVVSTSPWDPSNPDYVIRLELNAPVEGTVTVPLHLYDFNGVSANGGFQIPGFGDIHAAPTITRHGDHFDLSYTDPDVGTISITGLPMPLAAH